MIAADPADAALYVLTLQGAGTRIARLCEKRHNVMGRYHYVFPRWSNALLPAVGAVGLVVPLYVVFVVAYGFSPLTTDVGYQPIQPVPFSHALHAGELGLDCRYCHNTVERAPKAAVPPTQTCFNCHTQIHKDSPKLDPLWESYETGMPVEWIRVHDLPDFTYFNHSAHITRGVSCVECHGRIDKMEVVTQHERLTMGWCLDCHRGDPGSATYDRGGPLTDCAVCHH